MNYSEIFNLTDLAPVPTLDVFREDTSACKWGLTDLYPEHEKALRAAIDSGKGFDTGWCYCVKEIRSFRIVSDGKVITVLAYEEMDDIDDLIDDAIDSQTELTDDQEEKIRDYYYCYGMTSELESETTIPATTYEDVMKALEELENSNSEQLESWFRMIQDYAQSVIEGEV